MNKKHLIGYPVTALIALGIGTSGGGDEAGATDTPSPRVTATRTVTGPTVPGPTVTTTATVTTGPTVTVTAEPAPPAAAMAGDGTYEVGVDVKPGTYVATAPSSGNCYWARLSGSDGLDNIIDNDNTSGQTVITIKKSDKFFESSGCSDWTRR